MAGPKYDNPTVFNFLHDYGCDLRARRVFNHHHMGVSEEVGQIGIEYISRNLLHLDKSPGTIELWINNSGGWLHEMWAVIDIMNVMENPVDTVCYGNASSAACLLLASGTGTRYALPHASFMWHAGTTDISADMHWPDAVDRMEWEKRENERWLDQMARVTTPLNSKGNKFRTHKDRISFWADAAHGGGEKWLDAKEMVANGVVDEIWGPPAPKARKKAEKAKD
jgi:ATP-dependent protease ClpP protease subunit